MSSTPLALWALVRRITATWVTWPTQSVEAVMRKKWATEGFLGLLIFGSALFPVLLLVG